MTDRPPKVWIEEAGEYVTAPSVPSTDPLGPACQDLLCEWVAVPHVHEGKAVYPLPPDRPEWIVALAADEEAERVRPN